MFVSMNYLISDPPSPPPEEQFLTVKQYAEQKKVSVQAVYGKIKRSTLAIKKIGNFTLVKEL